MNRIYRGMCIALVAVLLLAAFASLFTGDAEIRPELTISSLLDGSWFGEYQAYYAHTFATRDLMEEDFLDLEGWLNFGEGNLS